MHGLVDTAILHCEPEIDDPERCDDTRHESGLLLDLAQRGLLDRLALLDVPLRQ